jgi:hypothetical protein
MHVKVRASCPSSFVRVVSVVVLASIWLPAPPSGAQSAVARPPEGRWARTTAALLLYSHDQCSGVGERTIAYWKRLSGGEGAAAALDQYILTRATAELTGARKALDIARDFLPTAVAEIDAVEGEILNVLYEADAELCDVVARPEPPRSDYENRIDQAEAEVEAAERGVWTILPPDVTENDLAKELEPYLGAIELAAGVAREQIRQELEVLKPPPEVPTAQDQMEAWFQGYQQAVAGAKSALRVYLDGRQRNDATAINSACKELQDAVLPLLADDQTVFRAPDAAVERPLKAVYTAMRRLGVHCASGQFRKADEAYAWMQEQLNRAAGALAPYSLRP